MIRIALPPILLVVLAAPVTANPGKADGVELAQFTVRERIIVRVPRLPAASPRLVPAPVKWKEKRGPKCIAVAGLAGALVTQTDSVDLVLSGGQRVRAKLEGRCRGINFYSGFYLKPASDGKVCADRDALRMRSGGTCQIAKFRTLKPEPVKR